MELAAQYQQSEELALRERKWQLARGPATEAIRLIMISGALAVLRADGARMRWVLR
jgi:hypothetical protein